MRFGRVGKGEALADHGVAGLDDKVLQEQVSNGTQDKVTSTRKSPSKPRTPKKPAGAHDSMSCLYTAASLGCSILMLCSSVVSNRRVAKSTPSGKSSKKNSLKQEAVERSFGGMLDDGFADIDSTYEGLGALDFESGMAMTNLYD